MEDSAPPVPEVSLEDFRKAKELDDNYKVIFGKSFKKKSLKKLRNFDPTGVKVKRIVYFCPKGRKSMYIPHKRVRVGVNRPYYLPTGLVVKIYYINAKEKVAYGSCI